MRRQFRLSVVCLLVAWPLVVACGDNGETNDNNDNQNQLNPSVCGNGEVEAGEVCDDGSANSDSVPDACRTSCRASWCGDGVLDSDEQCDEGGANSDLVVGACRRTCQSAGCGDGVIDYGEECDDANLDDADGCDADCTVTLFWRCEDQPSQCSCAPYRSDADCSACVVYVSQDATGVEDGLHWSSAIRTVQRGIDTAVQAASGDHCEVWVKAGMYQIFVDLPENTVRLAEGVALYGGFDGTEADRSQRDWETNRTVLNGASGPPGSAVYHVVTAVGVHAGTLDGFVIVGGCANGDAVHVYGGGMLNVEASPTVANCLFTVTPETESIDCSIYGGGIYNWLSDPTIVATTFTNLEAQRGGAIMNEQSAPLIEGCVFVKNDAEVGGAIYNLNAAPTIRRCVFAGNTASTRGGAMQSNNSSPILQASVFAGNWARDWTSSNAFGGALCNWSSDTLLDNVTFYGNEGEIGGALRTQGSPGPTLNNCVLWNNHGPSGTGQEISTGGMGTTAAAVTYSIIDGFTNDPANHNHGQNPDFVVLRNDGLITDSVHDSLAYLGITTFTLDGNHYQPSELVGRFLRTNMFMPILLPIVSNTANTIVTWGYAGYHNSGQYQVVSLMPDTGSPCIDGGFGDTSALGVDAVGAAYDDCGQTSTNDGGGTPDFIDRGAYEHICP